jgi:hypothetical protein
MKKLYVLIVFSFFYLLNVHGQNIGDYRSKTGGSGNWNDFNAWETYNGSVWALPASGQLPSSTSAVEIKTGDVMVINGTLLVSGNLTVNGSLIYNSTSTSKLTVSGNVTVGQTGIFTSPTSGSVLSHSLIIGGPTYNSSIGGNLVVDGIFNMNFFPSSGVAVMFTGTPNNSISGIGTIKFYTLSIEKGATGFNSVLEVVNSTIITMPDATVTVPKSLTIYDGTFKLSSASSLNPYYGTCTVCNATGRIWLNNKNASIKSVGAGTATSSDNIMQFGGTLQIDAGIFSFGAGNSYFNCQGDFILNGTDATLNIYGYIASGTGSSYIMTNGNINIYPQLGSKSVSASNSIFQFSGKTLNFSGGKLAIIDPHLNPGTDLAIDIQSGACNFIGSTILFGDGISDLDGTSNGFMVNTGGNFLGDVIINNSINSLKSTRTVKLAGNSCIAGNLIINTGTANQFFLNGNILTTKGNIVNNGKFIFDSTISSGLVFFGTNQQSIGGSGTFSPNVNNLTINNSCGLNPSVDLQIPLSVSNSLTLTNGSLDSSNGSIFTIGKSTVSSTFNIERSGGYLALTPNYALSDVSKLLVTYTAINNLTSIITGYELPASLPVKVFTISNPGGVILDKPVKCETLTLTAGNLTTSDKNSLTVTGPLFNSVVGGGVKSYINGPLTRTIPNNSNALNYKFPVGKTGYRLFEFQSLTTSGLGFCTFTVEAFDTGPYSAIAGSGMSVENTDKYWKFTAVLGNVTIASTSTIRITDDGLDVTKRISQSNNVSGTFNSVGGVFSGTTISSVSPVDYSAVTSGVFLRIGTAALMSAGKYAIGPKSSYDGYIGTYMRLMDAITAISTTPLSGNLIFEFQPDYATSVEIFPINLNIINNTTSTITFRPALNVNSVINFSTSGTVINNSGADYIQFDGRNGGTGTNKYLQFTNTDVSLPTVILSNDALYNQFLYCIFKGNTKTDDTGIMTLNGSVSGNNFYTIDHCSFNGNRSANYCLYTKGSATDATITNSDFYDFRNGAGICLASGSNNAVIDNNSFYQSTSYAGFTGTTSGIIVSGGDNVQISNNNIGGNKSGLTGMWTVSDTSPSAYNFTGINSISLSTTSKIYNNKIQNFDWKSTVSTWTGMNVSGNVNVGTDGANYIGDSTGTDNIKITYYQAGTSQVNGLLADGAAIIENNTIGSITTLLSGITATGTSFTGIYSTGTGLINNNIIGSSTVLNSINTAYQTTTLNPQNIYGIYSLGSSVSISNNIIANITNGSSVASGVTRGILVSKSASNVAISSNDIHSISTAQPVTGTDNSASLDGINIQANNASSVTISGNQIYDLLNSSPNAITVNGILYKSSTGLNNRIDKNFIHSFKSASNTAIQNGINIIDGAANIQNNVIRLGIDKDGNSVTGTAQINGILKSTGYGADFYFNTVYIGGTGVADGDVNTYAFNFSTKSTSLEEVKNNIFVNMRSNISSTKLNYALSIPSITNSWSSDYNNYFVSDLNGKLSAVGGKDLLTLKTLQDSYKGADLHSLFGDPLLSHPADALVTLDLRPLNISPVDGSGTPVSAVNNDISGNPRNLLAPTLGAYELDCSTPTSGGTISGDQIQDSIPVIILNIYPAVSYSGKMEYKWQNMISPFTSWSDISNSNTLSYQPGVLVQKTMFKRLARSTCSTDWTGGVESNVVTISMKINKWKGFVSNDWNNPENWTLNKMPVPDDDLIFDDNPLNDCLLDQDRSVNNIINNQSVYRLNTNGNTLIIKGNLLFTKGAQIDSSYPNSTLVLSGSTFQTIPFGVFVNEKVYNLTIDNSVGVSQDSDFTIDHLLTINKGKQLIIPTEKLLNVEGTINNNAGTSGLIIKASPTGDLPNGSLIFHNDGTKGSYVPATIEMYTKAAKINETYKWQFFGIPLTSVPISPTFDGSYIREMHENVSGTSGHWVQLQNESVLTSFTGYEITQEAGKTILLGGNLENADYGPVTLSYTSEATYKGQHLIGNPYMAAIKIKNDEIPSNSLIFGDGMIKTVYLYNTGSKNDWSKNGLDGEGNNDDAGQYLAIPKENAGSDFLPGSIPSMQAFLVMVKTPGPTATISIPYSSIGTMVKNSSLQRASVQEKIYTRIDVTGSGSIDHMWIFTDPDCTRGFDNGWDGYKMIGAVSSPQIYAMEADGNYQVNSVDDINNTLLGFKAGLDTIYTLTFTHHNKDTRYKYIYLMDLSENKTIDISVSGSQYQFKSNSCDSVENRFKIIANRDGIDISTEAKSLTVSQHSIDVFNSKKTILVNNKSSFNGNLYLFDLAGRFIQQLPFKANCITTLPVQISSGSYISKVITLKEEVISKMILQE